MATLRQSIHRQLEPAIWAAAGLSPVNKFLVFAILVASAFSILETEPVIAEPYKPVFVVAELAFGAIFLVEYALRFWSCAESDDQPWAARWRFARSVAGIIDLLVVLATILPMIATSLAVLRLVRLLRILQLAKLGRLSSAMTDLKRAVASRSYELGVTVALALGLLIFGASALYWLEGELQPDKFGSIPRALWWAVITLTTIGYGDVYPITVPGKIVASIVAAAGIGLIAMPTGILAAAFSEAIQTRGKS
jgi:voltage-gated potassium channel